MLRWITEVRRWIVLAVLLAGIGLGVRHFCFRPQSEPTIDRDLLEEALEEGWGIDLKPTMVTEKTIEDETGLPAEHIGSSTTAEFEQPVEKVEIVVTDEGDVFVTGETEVGERLAPVRIGTKKKRPKPGPWLKRDLGVGLGLAWDFDKTVEPCVRIQIFKWFESITFPDPIASSKYVGVSMNFPLRVWVLKNTSVGAALKWDYKALAPAPDVALTLTVRL